MKVLFPLLMASLLFSCGQKQNQELSQEQKKTIENEVQQVVIQIREAAAAVDTTKLFDAFSFANNEFNYMEITGAYYNEEQYKDMVRQFYGGLTTEIIGDGTEKYLFVSNEHVLWSYSGMLTAKYKTGQEGIYKPFGFTMLFRKIDNKWKAVFIQESTQDILPADSTKAMP